MNIKEYLNLEEINFGNEEEVVAMLMDPRLGRWVEAQARLKLGDDFEIKWAPTVTLNFHLCSMSASDICSASNLEQFVECLIARRVEIGLAFRKLLEFTEQGVQVKYLSSKWTCTNDYDALCNPERLMPRLGVELTAYYA